MDRHGFLPVDRSQNRAFGRCDAALPYGAALPYIVCDRGVTGSRSRRNLGQYRSCIVMMHDGVPSRKLATSGRPRTSNKLHLWQTTRVPKQDGHRARAHVRKRSCNDGNVHA